jgi:hypothetical protein
MKHLGEELQRVQGARRTRFEAGSRDKVQSRTMLSSLCLSMSLSLLYATRDRHRVLDLDHMY